MKGGFFQLQVFQRRKRAFAQTTQYSHMKKVGITRLRNNFSRYIDQVKQGESILVMDRNQSVAQIVPLGSTRRGLASAEDRLTRLERKGLIRRGTGREHKVAVKTSASEAER
jgi:prevent-host-death family protein